MRSLALSMSKECAKHTSPWTDRVTDIVGAVCKRGGTGSKNLDKGVGVFSLVGVLGGMSVDTSHTKSVRGAADSGLSGVNIVVDTVKKTSSDHGRKTLSGDLGVGPFVDLTRTHWVVAESAHSPAHWSSSLAEFGIEFGVSFGNKFFVGLENVVVDLSDDTVFSGSLLIIDGGNVTSFSFLRISAQRVERVLVLLLDDVVIGDVGFITLLNDGALEKERALEHIVPLDSAVFLEDYGVDVWNEEKGGQDSAASASSDGDTSDLYDISRRPSPISGVQHTKDFGFLLRPSLGDPL